MKKGFRHDEMSNIRCKGYPLGTCSRRLKARIIAIKPKAEFCFLCFKMKMASERGWNVKPQTRKRYYKKLTEDRISFNKF